MTIENRKSVFTKLKEFCTLSKEHDFLEVTEWNNGEGFDVSVSSHGEQLFQLTWGEYKALRKAIKVLREEE